MASTADLLPLLPPPISLLQIPTIDSRCLAQQLGLHWRFNPNLPPAELPEAAIDFVADGLLFEVSDRLREGRLVLVWLFASFI